ncbi:MAG: hypothetical protein ACOYXT_10630 [Bacteroidota bacterium]
MKKFALITVGFVTPTKEIMDSWQRWFESIGDRIVSHVGLVNGREVTPKEIVNLPMNREAVTGYMVINAQDINEAIEIAKQCPMITSTNVYEIMSHAENQC